MSAQQTLYITVTRVGSVLGRPRRCWSNHSHVLVQHCTSIAQTFGICQTGVCSIYASHRSLLFCKCTKLKRQYVLTCKASTYCHIISARAESCEKRVYLLFATPPHRDAKLKMCLATAAHNFKLLKIKSQPYMCVKI